MTLLGPKAPCPHCGKNVRKHHHPDDFLCPHCHQPGPWATQEQAKAWGLAEEQRRQAEQARADARARHAALVSKIAAGAMGPSTLSELAQVVPLTGYDQTTLDKLNLEAWHTYAQVAVADDVITPEENRTLGGLVLTLGLTWDGIRRVYPDLPDHLLIASINGGVLPAMPSHQLITKKSEVVHLELPTSLMKEVTMREFRGGYQGFSFPIGKTGVRYRVGGARGHSVVTGTQLQVADTGVLSISSQRAVFIGSRKTMEMPYPKLVNLTVFKDGIQFHMSNRQNAPLFKVANGEVAAAMVNASVQQLP